MARLLSLENLSKSFGGLAVFRSLNLDLASGERIGIVGPNGAGKSTLFNLISGVFAPTSGNITFDGRDLSSQRSWTRCRSGIGRTFQVPKPFGGMSVHDNLMVAAVHGSGLSMGDARQRVGEMLERTKLASKAARFAGELNLIDLKRLELARALALKPKLLLLDEIAGGLTTAECAELLAILKTFEGEEVAVIWIEHVIGALTQFVERVAVLAQGSIIADGKAEDVFKDPMVRSLYLGEAD